MNTATTRNEYSPAEALWAMYMSQSKAVRKAFRTRLHAEEEAESRRKGEDDGSYSSHLVGGTPHLFRNILQHFLDILRAEALANLHVKDFRLRVFGGMLR